MTSLSTPEVLRLLEGGNDSPLAKLDKFAALLIMRTIEGSTFELYSEWEDGWEWTPFDREDRDQFNETFWALRPPVAVRGTIPSEVVTRHLGQVWMGQYQPAIVISTGDAS